MTQKLDSAELLIEAVKAYPILYQKSAGVPGYLEEKNQAWNEIAIKLKEDVGNLKKKFRNLKDSYFKKIKNKKELEEIGHLDKYIPYKHEEKMSFLLPLLQYPDVENASIRKRKLRSDDSNSKRSK
jgi:hypothetical protein